MGATSTYKESGLSSRAFFEAEFPTMLREEGEILACVTKRSYGGWQSVFYAAVKTYATNEVWALVILIARDRSHREYYNFTYKDMGEDSGPSDRTAPAKVLDLLTPTTNEYALAWRQACRENLETEAARIRPKSGDTVKFANPLRFTNGETLTDLVFVERSTFRTPTGTRVRIPSWAKRSHEVIKVTS